MNCVLRCNQLLEPSQQRLSHVMTPAQSVAMETPSRSEWSLYGGLRHEEDQPRAALSLAGFPL